MATTQSGGSWYESGSKAPEPVQYLLRLACGTEKQANALLDFIRRAKPYLTDVSDEEWAFVAPYLILFPLDAGQRRHDLREVFNALRYVVRTGCPWRMLPNDLPPWSRVHQQMQRWFKAGCFEAIVHDLRMLLRLADGRTPHPSAAVLDSRTLQSTPTSGARAGYDSGIQEEGSLGSPIRIRRTLVHFLYGHKSRWR
ncbi:transposase [Zoogloea oleivorans]|uniref:Transposase n=1 Tax=Zoogloea oleivorans TaxID=1552750 RepID=A0A6C2CAY3_9RHOO|nr:transposase [Zoogloea oleivorans]